jgi:hypothetical protein
MSSVYPTVDAEPGAAAVEPDAPLVELSGRTTEGATGVGPSPQPPVTTASHSPMDHEMFRTAALSASSHLAVAGEVRNTIAVWSVRTGPAA